MFNNMTPLTSPQAMLDEFRETLEKGKITLTPQIREYLELSFGAVQDKLQSGQPVTREDLAFIEKVKTWIRMVEEDRKQYPVIEDMESAGDMDMIKEAGRRYLSIQQWRDLLHMAEASGKPVEWIDETFTFEGGKIICNVDLDISKCFSLTSLPSGLHIHGDCNLSNCGLLTSLPPDIHVGGTLRLIHCRGLMVNKSKVLPLLWDKLNKGEIRGLSLSGWPLEDGDIPDNLHIKGYFGLRFCNLLTYLPSGLRIGEICDLVGSNFLTSFLTFLPDDLTAETLCLSHNVNPSVIQDAERLKTAGKIKDIQYS